MLTTSITAACKFIVVGIGTSGNYVEKCTLLCNYLSYKLAIKIITDL